MNCSSLFCPRKQTSSPRSTRRVKGIPATRVIASEAKQSTPPAGSIRSARIKKKSREFRALNCSGSLSGQRSRCFSGQPSWCSSGKNVLFLIVFAQITPPQPSCLAPRVTCHCERAFCASEAISSPTRHIVPVFFRPMVPMLFRCTSCPRSIRRVKGIRSSFFPETNARWMNKLS